MPPSPPPAAPPPAGEPRRPRSGQAVAVTMADARRVADALSMADAPFADAPFADAALARRFQLHVSECVETKTVTTTTRLTRQFPRVFVRDPTPLAGLDAKEYPLACKPTPPELLAFSLAMPPDDAEPDAADGLVDDAHDAHDARGAAAASAAAATPAAANRPPKKKLPLAAAAAPTPTGPRETPGRPARPAIRSPSDVYPRRTRQTRASLVDSPTTAAAPVAPPVDRLSRSSSLPDKACRSTVQGSTTAPGADCSRLMGAATSATARRTAADLPVRGPSGFLATPDTSELAAGPLTQRPSRRRSVQLDRLDDSPLAGAMAQACDAESPSAGDAQSDFSTNVATPPVSAADAAPFADSDDALQQSVRALHRRPAMDVVAAQDASLPSPRLSPTLAASQLHLADGDDDEAAASFRTSTVTDHGASWADDESRPRPDGDASCRQPVATPWPGPGDEAAPPVVVDTQMLLDAFDSMTTEMKTFMMYQFLRRCPRSTLRVVANTVNPALKCDFLQQLPLELAYHVLSYLDCRDLCRAAQVSKHWRNIVDRNETGWKELLDRDGFTLPPGELKRAIVQGWGWQDPVGSTGSERDLSMQGRLTSSEAELTRGLRAEAPRLRTSKRKRGLNAYSAAERSKRRAGAHEPASRESTAQAEARQHKSEGPLSAANAAAAAVPDPQLGLPSLRQLHLFKSLYRRHHLIRRGWTSGEVRPSHVAFAAHPRHVITCLQFDDDKIITGSDDTLIHIYDTKTGKLRRRLEGHEGGVWALQYEGNVLVSGSTDRSVRVWDMERGLCQQVFYGHTSTVRCLQVLMPAETSSGALQPDKPLIITGSRDSQLRVWRLPELGSRRYMQTHPPAHESDCPYFIRALSGHSHSVRAIAAHGDTLVSGSYDSTVRVWRISTGEALHVLRGHAQKVYSVVLDDARNRCISGSMDSLVKIWDLATGACLHTLEGHSLLVGLLDLRDERLVSAAADSTLRIWDPETGRCRHTLMAHTGAITCFQHDGTKVISGSEKTVKMWDVRTGECIQDLLTDLSSVWQVKFDGRRCVAAVQRDQLTYVEILDFGAARDGQPPEDLGKRILLNPHEVRELEEGVAA